MASGNSPPPKRLKVDDGYVSSPSPSPIRFDNRTATPVQNAVVLYEAMPPIKKNPVSLTELVTSGTVTINVGPEHDEVNISKSLFQGISNPLHQLLNSAAVAQGDVSEINNYLQYDDKNAFLQLISMAYNTILKGSSDNQLTPSTRRRIGLTIPSDDSLGVDPYVAKTVKCKDCSKGNVWMDVKCDSEKHICNAPRLARDYGLQFFLELQLTQSHNVAAYITSCQFPHVQAPDPNDATTGKPYPLIHFAKAFNLAGKWQVHGLQSTSLLGFQNRLKRYIRAGPDEKTIEELLNVLRYLASTTSITTPTDIVMKEDPEEIETTKTLNASMLLKSLMRYICVHVSVLLQDLEFRQIVAEHGVIGLMLFEVLEETMIASKGDE